MLEVYVRATAVYPVATAIGGNGSRNSHGKESVRNCHCVWMNVRCV